MRIALVAIGTHGDIELFLILGHELKRRGHEIVFASSSLFADRLANFPFAFQPIGTGSADDLRDLRRSLALHPSPIARTQQFLTRWVEPELASSLATIDEWSESVDLFLSTMKLPRTGSRDAPTIAITYDPPASMADLFAASRQQGPSCQAEIVALSKPLVDPLDIWPAQYRFTGFWIPPDDFPTVPESSALADFLADRPAPVVVTMGSMGPVAGPDWIQRVVESARDVGRPLVVVAPDRDDFIDRCGEDVLILDEARYDTLFRHACCVIHHGGVGTTAACLNAGAVSLVAPQIATQREMARMLLREDLATALIEPGSVPSQKAMIAAISDERYRSAAHRWQRIVIDERGVERAADLIEHYGSQ